MLIPGMLTVEVISHNPSFIFTFPPASATAPHPSNPKVRTIHFFSFQFLLVVVCKVRGTWLISNYFLGNPEGREKTIYTCSTLQCRAGISLYIIVTVKDTPGRKVLLSGADSSIATPVYMSLADSLQVFRITYQSFYIFILPQTGHEFKMNFLHSGVSRNAAR